MMIEVTSVKTTKTWQISKASMLKARTNFSNISFAEVFKRRVVD